MKVHKLIGCLFFIMSTGCVSTGDLKRAQLKVQENAKNGTVYSSVNTAFKAKTKSCLDQGQSEKWSVTITNKDSLVKQEKGRLGYFKTLCFDKKSEHKTLKVTGVHAGGGMGKAFFVVPKVFIFDKKGRVAAKSIAKIKHSAWSGHLEEKIDISKLPTGRHTLVVEADNRGEKVIGAYTQRGVVSVTVMMYSLPTGKIKFSLKKK